MRIRRSNWKIKHNEDNTVSIELSQGQSALVDAADLPIIFRYKWYAERKKEYTFYASTVCGPGKNHLQMHRLILPAPDGFVIDHINGNGLDNRRSNLRVVTRSQNMHNQRKQRNSSSRFKGVCKDGNRWRAAITVPIGVFDTEEEAAVAYNDFVKKFRGEYGYLNDLSAQR
ncbi:MAG: HNH endonuclease [Desulfobacterales bacterium]|nr:HNH endonuclease [Desulfobacterales bacterium]